MTILLDSQETAQYEEARTRFAVQEAVLLMLASQTVFEYLTLRSADNIVLYTILRTAP